MRFVVQFFNIIFLKLYRIVMNKFNFYSALWCRKKEFKKRGCLISYRSKDSNDMSHKKLHFRFPKGEGGGGCQLHNRLSPKSNPTNRKPMRSFTFGHVFKWGQISLSLIKSWVRKLPPWEGGRGIGVTGRRKFHNMKD